MAKLVSKTYGEALFSIAMEENKASLFLEEAEGILQILKENPEFTVNIPLDEPDSHILTFCGRNSGRDTDKFRQLGLTAVESEVIRVPGIAQLPLTLECRVLYEQSQDPLQLPQAVLERFYPVEEKTGVRDHHIAFYGEIVNAYIAE